MADDHGRFTIAPTQADLERFCFLDDVDCRLVAKRRCDQNRLGFALQMVTVRMLGTFLADPLDVPTAVVVYVAGQLEIALHHVAGRLEAGDLDIDAEGRLHAAKVDAVADPPSLIDLRARCEAMLPEVDIGELILEVMAWEPKFVAAFATVSGGHSRLADLNVSVAAALTAQALNVGYRPVISPGVPALTRDRISHVDQNYLRAENFAAANGPLIDAQAVIALARRGAAA